MRYLIIFTLLFISCNHSSEMKQVIESNKVKSDSSTVEAAYVCPMGKECGSSNLPGKCPSCGMKLRPNKNLKKI